MAKQTVAGRIFKLSRRDAKLDPWPIPQDQIISGNPAASGKILWQSDDKRLANGFWECAPGAFTWNYTWDETIYFLEGKVAITDEAGKRVEVGAGDLIYVPTGTKAKWEITERVRKAFHFKSATPVEL